jgi:hypothetical protein
MSKTLFIKILQQFGYPFSCIASVVVMVSLSGCAQLHLDQFLCKRGKEKVVAPSGGKVVIPAEAKPKPEAKNNKETAPNVVLIKSDCADHDIIILYLGAYRGGKIIYFVGFTNKQKVSINFGTQNISVSGAKGKAMEIYIPPERNFFENISNLWLRYPNYRNQLLVQTFTVEPEWGLGGVVIVDESPVTTFQFDVGGQKCSATFSEK